MLRYHCSVVHLQPFLEATTKFCIKFLLGLHLLSQTGGCTLQGNCLQDMGNKLVLLLWLAMISHALTKLCLLQIFLTLTCSSCWGNKLSVGSASVGSISSNLNSNLPS